MAICGINEPHPQAFGESDLIQNAYASTVFLPMPSLVYVDTISKVGLLHTGLYGQMISHNMHTRKEIVQLSVGSQEVSS